MSTLETKAFRAFPNGDAPCDIRPLTAVGVGAMIAGLAQAKFDIERSMIDGARIMRLVTGAETLPATSKDPEGVVKFLADQWLRSYGSYSPAEEGPSA
jgi:hypothetical protein